MRKVAYSLLVIISIILFQNHAISQSFKDFIYHPEKGLIVTAVTLQDGSKVDLIKQIPLFSFDLNGITTYSSNSKTIFKEDMIHCSFKEGIEAIFNSGLKNEKEWQGTLEIRNVSSDTVKLENVVPFGKSVDHLYLTGHGPPSLSRAYLFLPDKEPVNVILPDNAWEMGYASMKVDQNISANAIARRTSYSEDAVRRRFYTLLPPGASVNYTFYADLYTGAWQNGLRKMFRDRHLEDLDEFDNILYERPDLSWIRDDYLIALQMAWDKEFYDFKTGQYNYYSFLDDGKILMGGYDVYGLWPGWPRLGLDERNQWQLYKDLPGGLSKIRELAEKGRESGTRFFISYNPWDRSTNFTNHLSSMAYLIKEVNADGVVLDTRGKSSKQLQDAADSVRQGVVMYSEGMAITKDMPGIVSGRVHNAIYWSPILNLNKVIKPEFAIFRVNVLHRGAFERDISISFFNGYGTEINFFNAGRPDWVKETFEYLGKTTKILRENTETFHDRNWTPLISTRKDKIWVNKWNTEDKTIYTILSMRPEGSKGPLFEVTPGEGYHFVSLWSHKEIVPTKNDRKFSVFVSLDEYSNSFEGTNREGAIECIARLPKLLSVKQVSDSLKISTTSKGEILVWKGNPSYQNTPVVFKEGEINISLKDHFKKSEGKFVVQLMNGGQLKDEVVIEIEPGTPQLISQVQITKRVKKAPKGMVKISSGVLQFQVSNPDQFIPYPDFTKPQTVKVNGYFMDRYPVTNKEFYEFIKATSYAPGDTANYLKHWENGKYPEQQEDHPVVYISRDDAVAYAKWIGKRLPTEIEWQFAAQGSDGRKWPWGNKFVGTNCNNSSGQSTAVNQHPKGGSKYGVEDLIGNVWQITNDVYDNGSYRFAIIRGGSFFNPTSSIWYVKGGPQPLDRTQMLLLVSPGFDRSSTVGFRCVIDAK